MKKQLCLVVISCAFVSLVLAQQNHSPWPVPSRAQLQWHNMEFYLFFHFGPNTFTDKEWGLGDEPESLFHPSQLDCRQWCRVAKAAGAKGVIITAKHHDGFCLWPSHYSTHTVRESKWKNGKGDVLKELSHACKEYGLKFGVYLSPWDRNHPKYGTPEYNEVFVNMMKEIFYNYGPIWELWWDGANGEGLNGKKQVYDWKRFEKTVREISPGTVVFSDIGPDIRWVGNENGIAGQTNWNTLDTAGFGRGGNAPPTDSLNQGNINGRNWIPAECDVSIRPGWFYHKEEDEKVKTPGQLFDLYLKSVGRGANLLLNVPPDRRGLINEMDIAALTGFRKRKEECFKNNLALKVTVIAGSNLHTKGPDENRTSISAVDKKPTFLIKFNPAQKINCLVLKEGISTGQSIESFTVALIKQDGSIEYLKGTTIGKKRIIPFPSVTVRAIKVTIEKAKNTPRLNEVAAYSWNEGEN